MRRLVLLLWLGVTAANSCDCAADGWSGSVLTPVSGCSDHDGEGDVWCFVVAPANCTDAHASSSYPGAGWRSCEPQPPPPQLPPSPPVEPPAAPSPRAPPSPPVSPPVSPPPSSPPPRYVYHSGPRNWGMANRGCLETGGTLAMIADAEANAEVAALVPPGQGAWIGLSDSVTEAKWVWPDGSFPDFTSWAPGNPTATEYVDEDCALLEAGTWRDQPCSDRAAYVCLVECPSESCDPRVPIVSAWWGACMLGVLWALFFVVDGFYCVTQVVDICRIIHTFDAHL